MLFEVVDEIVAAKRASSVDAPDLLTALMHAGDVHTGERMTDAQLRDEVVTMLLAGHETTAVTLTWAWGASRPAAQRFTPRLVAGDLPATEYLVLARPAGPVSARIEARRPAIDRARSPV